MNVLVIPEDFRNDQYLLRPLVQALLTSAGRPRAKVRILTDPLLGGISHALDVATLRDKIFVRYRGMVDLFLLLVDRDAVPARRAALATLETTLRPLLSAHRCFLAENAHQEVEVWALAGTDLPKDWVWADIRQHRDPKEAYFDAIAARRDLQDEPGEGRDTLGQEAAARLDRVKLLCPEVGHLSGRIGTFVTTGACAEGPYDG